MTHSLPSLSRRLARRLFSTRPRKPTQLHVECLEARENPTGVYSGVVFEDFNANGTRDLTQAIVNGGGGTVSAAIDNGVSGVTVTAYSAANVAVGTVTTGADGGFAFTPTGAGPYRIEFTALPAGYSPGPQGLDSRTTVQFVADGGNTGVSAGVTRAGDYAQDDPLVATGRYVYGSGNGTEPGIVAVPYSAGGTNPNTPGFSLTVPVSQVGATYGLAFDSANRDLYASAYFKRHTALGPNGTGAIYKIPVPAVIPAGGYSPAPGSLLYADLNAIFGANTAGANQHDTNDYDHDNGNTGWAAVGTTGLGGMAASADGKSLFVMNLADRQLYMVPTSGVVDATTVKRVSIPLGNPDSTAIPAGDFTSGDLRPFAVQYYRGQVYVGVTYTAQTFAAANGGVSAQAARDQLVAAVYRLDPATMTFNTTPVLTTRLNYPRSQSPVGFDGNNNGPDISPWRAWSATYFRTTRPQDIDRGVAPQPMLTDLAFDQNGNVALGIRDRGADQTGFFAESDPANPTAHVEGFTAGDLLRAFINTPNDLSSGWTLESNARGTLQTPGGPVTVGNGPQNNNAGPGGGEFYYQENYGTAHGETSMGSALQLPGRPDVLIDAMDPASDFRAGGFSFMSNTTGAKVKAYQIYHTTGASDANQNATFGKANGLGGLAALLDPAPIEVGDRVFRDANSNGIQDAGEAGIAGVAVDLLDSAGNVISTATTDGSGNYYFTSAAGAAGTAADARRFGVNLDPNTAYALRVANAIGGTQQGALAGLRPTLTNADATLNGNLRDSDGTLTGTTDAVTFTTAGPGQDNHALDFGFANAYSLGNRVWLDKNDSGSIDAADGANPGIDGVAVRLYLNGGTAAVASTTTAGGGYYRFDNLLAGSYVVEVDTASAPLAGLSRSTPVVTSPNAGDSRNNGAVVGFHSVRSNPVVLGPTANAPTGETDFGPGDTATPAAAPDAQSNLTVDFGFRDARRSLGGQVYYDANNDGVRNGTEPLIAGQPVTFTLTGTDEYGNAVSLTTTTTTGVYNFANVPVSSAAGYTITETTQPNGYFDGKDKAGTPFGGSVPTVGDTIAAVVVPNDGLTTAGTGYDFGELLPAKLGDTVWLDANGDGRLDNGELGVNGVTVTLSGTDDRGTVTRSTTTDATGQYGFGNLRPGSYTVKFDNVANGTVYTRTFQNVAGSTTADDSNPDRATGVAPPVTLVAGQTDLTIDQGLFLPVSVGDTVFLDQDTSGTQNNGEPGIAGAVVTLGYAGPDGAFGTGDDVAGLAAATTDATGQYLFANLAPGSYRVTVNPANGTANGTPVGGVFPTYDLDSGTTNPDAATLVGPIPSDTSRLDADFGFKQLGSIGDRVWLDLNADGIQQSNEPGLAGVPVTLTNLATGQTTTLTTGADGLYLFPNLKPGDYRVTVNPAGTNLSATFDFDSATVNPDNTARRTLTAASPTRLDVDFGLRGTASLGDTVWYDADNSGTQNNAEPGIAGVPVTLTGAGADNALGTADDFTLTATTDANGKYLFANLPVFGAATPYRVTVTPPAQYPSQTFDADGTGTANQSTTRLAPNGVDLAQDFGYRGPSTQGLGDFVWLDQNGNGHQDAGEAGVNGVTVQLLDANGNVLASTVTAPNGTAQGFYEFRGLAVGTYSVRFGNTANGVTYTRTAQTAPGVPANTDSNASAANGQTNPVAIAANGFDRTIDAGLFLPAALGDTVWYDADNSGTQNNGEPGIPGVAVTLDYAGTDGVFGTGDDVAGLASATTDAGGHYAFPNLAPGTYRVRVNAATLPNGLTAQTFDLDGLVTANQAAGFVASGLTNPDFDFGYRGTATLGDTVWYDLDRSGTQNNGEPGVVGVRVNLTWAGFDGKFGTADDRSFPSQTTDAAGKYLFTSLPSGNFRTSIDPTSLPAGVTANTFDLDSGTTNPNGTADAPLAIGQNRTDVDFGVAGTQSIGDRVWLDANGDGVQNSNEPGITGATVALTWFGPDGQPGGGDDVTETATTGPNGIYSFGNLPPGSFQVAVTGTPPGLTLTGDPQGPLDGRALVTLPVGVSTDTVDFGYRGNSSLSGHVFVDSNGDGRLTAGEAPIPGTIVTLTGTDTQGNAVTATATVATDGTYVFLNLVPGSYSVAETQPAAYGDGGDALGTVNGTPSGSVSNDLFRGVVLGGGQSGVNYDFGETPAALSGTVFLDPSRDGTRDPGEPGIPGVTVTLVNTATGQTFTTTTGPDGGYAFVNLPAGTYSVTETQPGGFGDSPTGPSAPNGRTVIGPPGAPVSNVNFGDTLGAIGGVVYSDLDGDGTRNPGEPGIGGVLVQLVNTATGQKFTAITDANGGYVFPNLPAGPYRVVETQPAGYTQGANAVGTAGGNFGPTDTIDTINLAPGAVAPGYNFGERAPQAVSGTVFTDRNRDGVLNAGDTGTPGVLVQLIAPNGQVVATTTTDANGKYLFPAVPVGNYTLVETIPTGFGGTTTTTQPISVGTRGVAGVNFGVALGSLAGTVYRDNNLNGTRDTSANPDTGIAGVTLTLLDGTGRAVATTTTDANGNFLFADLPAGTYTVVETQPGLPTTLTNGFFDGSDNVGSLGGNNPVKNRLGVALPGGAVGTGYNFGELPPADPFGFVYVDANRNGRRDAGERGIAGVAITISGTAFAGTPFAHPLVGSDIPRGSLTVRTDADGRFEFSPIPPGFYSIAEAQPAGYFDGLEENADPNGPNPVLVGDDVFANLALNPFPVRGPFNFGELLQPAAVGDLPAMDFFPTTAGGPGAGVGEMTKRNFLGTTDMGAVAAPVAVPSDAPPLPTAPNFSIFGTPSTTYVAAAEDAGGGTVRVFDFGTGIERFRFQPFPGFTGGVRVATADVTGDGIPDIIATPGVGGGPVVRVFDGSTGREVRSFMAFEEGFRGGLQIAAADITGDGVADIIVTPDQGGGPIVRAFDGRTGAMVTNFFALDDTFRGGLRIATGDVNGDGTADLVVTAGVGGGPRVAVYDGKTLATGTPGRVGGDFFGFAPELRSGFWVTAGDVDGDGYADIVLSAGAGGGPRVIVYNGKTFAQGGGPVPTADFFAGDPAGRTGVRVLARDLTGDNKAELVSAPAPGARPVASVYDPRSGTRLDQFYAFSADFLGGVYLG